MKSFHFFIEEWRGTYRLLPFRIAIVPLVFLAAFLTPGRLADAQAVESAEHGGPRLSAGGTVSGYSLGYGDQKLGGISAFVVADGRQHVGFEGEARWLFLHQTNQEHATTYLAGPRYSMYYGRFQPYAKGLIGLGQFNYPYNLGRDNSFVVAPGGGFDYRLTNRIRWRAVDFEYQFWPQFHYGLMSSYGLSTGIRIKIF